MAANISPLPRPFTSGSLPKMHLPLIEHPMSRMGDHSSLSVHGEMTRLGVTSRDQPYLSMDEDGGVHLGLDHTSLPPLTLRGGSANTLMMFGSQSDASVRNLSDKGKFRRAVENTPRVGIEELQFMLADKIAIEAHGIRHLFKMNDPNGQGAVTREALLKIFYNLVGYISDDQFSKLLKRMGLDNKTHITYEDLAGYFTYEENNQKVWLDPINHKVEIQKKNIEEHLRRSPTFLLHDKHLTASTCHALLKDRIHKRLEHDGCSLRTLFPESCKDDNSLILPMHLMDMMKDLDIPIRQETFTKLWQRYDKEGVGAIRQTELFKILGLDKDGYMHVTATPRNLIVNSRAKTFVDVPMKMSIAPQRDKKADSNQQPAKGYSVSISEPKKTSNIKYTVSKKIPKGAESVIEALHYKLEEPYELLQAGLKCFDFLQDGFITKIDLKKVLDEFGLSMMAMDIDPFLSRIGLRVLRNQVPYRELLDKYWNRSEGGIVNRITKSNKYFFLNEGYHSYGEHLTPEQLEAKLVEFLHKDYFLMAEHFRTADRHKLGVITKHEFRDGVQRALGYVMSDVQWENLLKAVQPEADDLVPYTKFLDLFSTGKPGQWKREFQVPQPQKHSAQLAVHRLQEISAEEARRRQPELDRLKEETSEIISIELKQKIVNNLHNMQQEKHGRPLSELNNLVHGLFQSRFIAVDSAFKSTDRRMTGRVSKQQFGDILRQCDLDLLPLELDRIWDNLNISSDGMITFSSLVHHFKDSGMKNNLTTGRTDNKTAAEDTQSRQYHGKYSYAYHNVSDDELVTKRPNVSDSQISERRTDSEFQAEFVKRRHQTMPELSTRVNVMAEILDKIKPAVRNHWTHLKDILYHTDQYGRGVVLGMDMKDILKTLQMPLTDGELHKLLSAYDKTRDGYFHYLDFLNHYASMTEHGSKGPWDENFISEFRQLLKQKETAEDRTYLEIMARLRQELNRPPLLKEHKSIRRAFKKADVNGEGVLSIPAFRGMLKSCNLKVDAEDFYHIISQFDENMDGKISYPHFLAQVMT